MASVIVASTVSSVMLLIAIAVVAIIMCAAAKRFRHTQLVLQVTGVSMDILDEAKLQSIRYNIIILLHGYVNNGFVTKRCI